MKFYQTPAQINRSLPYHQTRAGRWARIGGNVGMAVGIMSRLAPMAVKTYGRYLMRGGLFGMLANVNGDDKKTPQDTSKAMNSSLAKSAFLSQLFTVVRSSRKGTRMSSLRSALILAGAQKALPVIATFAFNQMNKRKSR